MQELFERFITERRYLKNITARTEYSYNNAKNALFRLYGTDFDLSELSKEKFSSWVISMRKARLSASGANVYIRTVNAFLRWLQGEGLTDNALKIPLLKEDSKVIRTFTPEQVERLIHAKPLNETERRIRMLVCLLLDTGIRIDEGLSLRRTDVDFDNLLLRVKGKGNKERLLPMSAEMRKLLYRYVSTHRHELVFGTARETKMLQSNVIRDFKAFASRLEISGVRISPHTLRHTFSVQYLRRGGNLYYLSRILGHASVKTTERYLQGVQTDDLKAVHNGLSMLTR